MLQFTCANCGMPVTFNEVDRHRPAVCPNCNTRQNIPGTAVPASARLARSVGRPGIVQPTYSFTGLIAIAIVVIGVIQGIAFIFLAMANKEPLLILGIASGIMTMGLGLGLLCLCNIAIDLWHIRHQ